MKIANKTGDMFDFTVEVELLPKGSFAKYTSQRQAEGADLAHLKPPHINPSDEVLTLLVVKPEKAKAGATVDTKANGLIVH